MAAVEKQVSVSLSTADKVGTDRALNLGGKPVDTSETVTAGLCGTGGAASYGVRVARDIIQMNSTPNVGGLLWHMPLDARGLDPALDSLMEKFMQWTISDVRVCIKCLAPFATASGTAQIFYNKDPENPITSDPAKNILLIMRLCQSMQVSSKGELEFDLAPEELLFEPIVGPWRYCKSAKNPYTRLERFGEIGAAVRGPPAAGDGTAWTVTFTANFHFRNMTQQLPIVLLRAPNSSVLCQYDDDATKIYNPPSGGAGYNLDIKIKNNTGEPSLPDAVGSFYLTKPLEFYIHVKEGGDSRLTDGPVFPYHFLVTQFHYRSENPNGVFLTTATTINVGADFAEPILDKTKVSFPDTLSGFIVTETEPSSVRTPAGIMDVSELGKLPISSAPQSQTLRHRLLRALGFNSILPPGVVRDGVPATQNYVPKEGVAVRIVSK